MPSQMLKHPDIIFNFFSRWCRVGTWGTIVVSSWVRPAAQVWSVGIWAPALAVKGWRHWFPTFHSSIIGITWCHSISLKSLDIIRYPGIYTYTQFLVSDLPWKFDLMGLALCWGTSQHRPREANQTFSCGSTRVSTEDSMGLEGLKITC